MELAEDRATRGEPRLALGLVLVVALVLRLLWWFAYVEVIENEGVVYARLAQNLLSGEGMIGIFGGRDVMFPPLFPALIGLVALVTGSEELAGRVISLLCGTALVGVLYALTRHVFNARAAIVVGALAAVHPLLIALSVSVYSEGPWIFLTLWAAYCLVRSFTSASAKPLLAAGLIAGCAYLVRPEGLAFIASFAIALLTVGALQRRTPIEIVRTTGLFLAASVVVALPQIVYLSSLAGGFRWEGKSAYNNVTNERIRTGMTVVEATRGLDANGHPTGVNLNLHLDQAVQLRQPSASAGSLVGTLLADPVERTKRIARQTLTSNFISAPWVFALGFIGVVLTPWWRTRFFEGTTLIGVSLLQGLLLFSVDFAWTRYFFCLTPLLLMWSGAGLEGIATRVSTLLFRRRAGLRRVAAYGICLCVGAAMALAAFEPVRAVGDLSQADDRVGKEMGQWMAADARLHAVTGRPIVMGIALNSTYYAGGTMRYLPFAKEDAALAYVHRMQPHYLVLRESDVKLQQTPYAGHWMQRGIPDACAALARDEWSSSNERARVWRWTCSATDPSPAPQLPSPTQAGR